MFVLAVTKQFVVDELVAIVGIHAQQREGQTALDEPKGRKHVHLSLVARGGALGPARFDVGEVERPGMFAARIAAVMGDQVHLGEAGTVFVPLGPGANRNLILEQGARLGAAARLAPYGTTHRVERATDPCSPD